MNNQVKVGIGIMIIKDGKILLGKRRGSHGAGDYSFPGGYLEYMESFADCIKRELKEEVGIEVQNIRFLNVVNHKQHAPKHNIGIGMSADWQHGEPQVLEPEKCEHWNWYSLDALPQPIFVATATIIEAYKTGKNFFDE